MFKRISFKVAICVNLLLLVVMCVGTFFITRLQDQSVEEQLLERGRILAILGAKFTGKSLEEAIDNGVFSINDVFDTEYQEIPGFDPPKYHTKYDFYLDKALLSLQNEFFKDDSVTAAVAVDINGYLPTHNTSFQQAITWDTEKDRLGNHTKRIFNDPVGLKAARNREEGLLQKYERDTGEITWDIAAPIMVKERHWGNFRVGFSIVKAEQRKNVLRQSVIIVMLSILVFSCAAVVITVSAALKPLEQLTDAASHLADGDVETPITWNSADEVGRLADVLERLRISLKKVMILLRKKGL